MSKKLGVFNVRVVNHQNQWLGKFQNKEVQCPCCKTWHVYYYEYDLRGVKLHIRKWATKEATAYALGDIKKGQMYHLKFWKQNSHEVGNLPKAREWTI